MRHIIKICYEQNLPLAKEVREFLKRLPKSPTEAEQRKYDIEKGLDWYNETIH